MFGEPFFWIICPMMFFGMMIVCMIFFGRRRRWLGCFPFDNGYSYRERIRRLEEEIDKLKGK